MARLAAEAQMLYYPTDPALVRRVATKLTLPANNTIALDPCCGTGAALAVFRENAPTATLYGVELNRERAQEADKALDVFIAADALHISKSEDWASVLFLNPPYGQDSYGNRLESRFVQFWGRTPRAKGGYLVLVINPSSANEEMAGVLVRQGYAPIGSYKDSDNSDNKRFNQFVILLKRIDRSYRHDFVQMLDALTRPASIDTIDNLPQQEAVEGFAPKSFRSDKIADWQIDEMLTTSKLLAKVNAAMHSFDGEDSSIETPNDGQAAILVASGVLNRMVGGYLLKGKVETDKVTSADVDEEGEVRGVRVSQTYRTVIYGWHIHSNEFVRFE